MTKKFDPGGIKIIGTDKYEDDVYKLLDDPISKNPAGNILLKFIDDNPKYIRIVPYTGGDCKAWTDVDVPPAGHAKNVIPYAGHPDNAFLDAKGQTVVTTRDDKAGYTGTGEGSDVHIRFTPGIYGGSGCFGGNYGSQADEVLLHELVHALRDMQGLDNPIPTRSQDLYSYMNEEEWLAILIANIYISAKNNTNRGLRKDYDGFRELEKPLNTPVGFLNNQDHRKLVQKYWREETLLFISLAGVPAPYNPLFEFTRHLTKYLQP